MKKIIVEKYNPKWKTEFDKASKFYNKLLSEICVKIEHVGSTSVEGLMAKPILDIDIIVKNSIDSLKVIELLKSVEYRHIGNLGLEGREAFRYDDDNKYIKWMRHNLYVCLEGNENLKNHLLLRKHLRSNKKSMDEYGQLKLDLSKKFEYDIDSYIYGKTDLILSFLEREGMEVDKLSRIENINKLDDIKNPKIINIETDDDYKIVAISDIHGHKDLLEALISKLNLDNDDYLIIIGDFINRGIDSYETYEYIKELSIRKNTIVLKGNHESFMQRFFDDKTVSDKMLEFLKDEHYETILSTIIEKNNSSIHSFEEGAKLHDFLYEKGREVTDFLKSLPILLHFDEFTFVHGGFDASFDIEKEETKFLKFDNYNELSEKNAKKTVVGHWPASNLRDDRISNAPYFNNDKNIVFIDGGLGIKPTGELNAFIIEKKNNKVSYDYISENKFDKKKIIESHEFCVEETIYLDYPHFDFEVLSQGEEMSMCRHIFSGKTFSVFNSLLERKDDKFEIKTNYINKFLNLNIGDDVEICLVFEDCVLVKHGEEFGWILSSQL